MAPSTVRTNACYKLIEQSSEIKIKEFWAGWGGIQLSIWASSYCMTWVNGEVINSAPSDHKQDKYFITESIMSHLLPMKNVDM